MTRPLVLVACLVAVVATAVNAADVRCGKIDGVTEVLTCPSTAPCCSSEGYCGISTVHCGDHCQSPYSFNSKPGDPKAACYGDRFGRKCVSGFYNFSGSTWVINADSYNGNPDTADWLAEPRGLQAGNIKFGQYGGVMLSLSPTSNNPAVPFKKDANGNYPTALGARLSSTSYMLYGTFRARYIASPAGGVVTAFISYSDEKDEIDWETTGRDIDRGQSNFFYRGVVDYTKSSFHPTGTDTSRVYHDYEIRWAEDSITWVLDGEIVRIVNKEDTCSGSTCAFPSTPSKIEIAIWDGGAGSAGTRDWAGGYVPWDQTDASGYNVTYQYIMIQCNGDPVPTGPPRRTKGPNYSAPSLKEPVINVAAPGVAGYDESLMNSTGSVYTQQQKVNAGIINSTSKSDASVVRGRSVVGALSSVVVIGLGVGLFGLI